MRSFKKMLVKMYSLLALVAIFLNKEELFLLFLVNSKMEIYL